MKLTFFIFLISITISAQRLRPVIGGTIYLDTQFYKSNYLDLSAGIDYKLNKYIKPEIRVSYFFGALQDDISYDSNYNITSITTFKVSAVNFSFCPKINLFKEEDGGSYFQILPRYNISKIEATGKFLDVNQSTNPKSKIVSEKISETQHSVGIGLGICIKLSENKSNALAINLYYQRINLGSALTKLNLTKKEINTRDVLGLGIDYYFSVK